MLVQRFVKIYETVLVREILQNGAPCSQTVGDRKNTTLAGEGDREWRERWGSRVPGICTCSES